MSEDNTSNDDSKHKTKPKVETEQQQQQQQQQQYQPQSQPQQPQPQSTTKTIEQLIDEFDPGTFAGFPMDAWQRYYGEINDNRITRRAALAPLEAYQVRYNKSGNIYLPEWQEIELRYYAPTTGAWNRRADALAELDDIDRNIQIVTTKLGEMQNLIAVRRSQSVTGTGRFGQGESSDLQRNVNFLESIPDNLSRTRRQKEEESDRRALQMYFHIPDHDLDRIYENMDSEDRQDVLGACDFKQQQGGRKNLLRSGRSAIPATPAIR